MHVIARSAVRKAQRGYADAIGWLNNWWRTTSAARWENLHQVRADYPATDQVGSCLVFNAGGNKYRLICGVTYANDFTQGTLYIKHFLTHAEYDKGNWKADCQR